MGLYLILSLQIALLVAGINYVLEVESTLERVDEGNNSALTGYHDMQVREWSHHGVDYSIDQTSRRGMILQAPSGSPQTRCVPGGDIMGTYMTRRVAWTIY